MVYSTELTWGNLHIAFANEVAQDEAGPTRKTNHCFVEGQSIFWVMWYTPDLQGDKKKASDWDTWAVIQSMAYMWWNLKKCCILKLRWASRLAIFWAISNIALGSNVARGIEVLHLWLQQSSPHATLTIFIHLLWWNYNHEFSTLNTFFIF